MSRTRWFRDADDRERPPWCERKPPDEHWDSGWYGHDVTAIIERLRDVEPEVTAVVERFRDIIQAGPPAPYVDPDWSTMTNESTAWSRQATSEDVMADVLRAIHEMARLKRQWEREDIEIMARMSLSYQPLWMRYMDGI